jgi:hypothetical protein
MGNYSIFALLAQHPWLIGVLAVVVIIILVLPNEVRIVKRAGHVYRRCRGLLWEYRTGPNEQQLRLPGVRRLQQALLQSLRTRALWRWLWELLR